MKISEAIRLGSMLRPQAKGKLRGLARTGFLGLFGKKVNTSCALGAAFEAGGCIEEPIPPAQRSSHLPSRGTATATTVVVVRPEWYELLMSNQSCPECGAFSRADRTIAHLNDRHRWTRERIADWLEPIEFAKPSGAPASLSEVPSCLGTNDLL